LLVVAGMMTLIVRQWIIPADSLRKMHQQENYDVEVISLISRGKTGEIVMPLSPLDSPQLEPTWDEQVGKLIS
jgi:hypothetical protein